MSWEGMRGGGCAAIVRRALRDVPRSAVEVDRTSVAYFEIVVTVLKCASQADAFCFTASDVKIKLWTTSSCFGAKADVSREQRVPGSGDAELVGSIIVAYDCSAASAIVCRSEGVGRSWCSDGNCS